MLVGDERSTRGWLSPQVLLGVAGVLTFLLVPVQINTVYEGLPAHPLLLHVPVILIPSVAAGTLIVACRSHWFERYAVWLCAVAVIALGSLNLTMSAGDALRGDLQATFVPSVANLISRHAHAAGILRVFMIAFTAALIVAVALDLHARGRLTGIGFIDAIVGGVLKLIGGVTLARAALGLLALGCLYFVFLTGDLGARAVWQGRLEAAHHSGGSPQR